MAWTAADIPDQSGNTVVITGANSGIGYHTALELARHGAHVVMACRNEDKATAAMSEIRDEVPDAALELIVIDLSDLASVRAFVEAYRAGHDTLDVLVNNAGLMATPEEETAQGFELQLGVNHLGHFALTGLLLESLTAGAPSRVVNVTSGMHQLGRMDFDDLDNRNRYNPWRAYNQSKLANLLFAFELERRLRASGRDVKSIAAHPGYAASNLQKTGSDMGDGFMFKMQEAVLKMTNALFSRDAAAGALPSLYAATAPTAEGGGFYGPNGPFGVWGTPVEVTPHRLARDREDAARLWEISEERTGVRYGLDALPTDQPMNVGNRAVREEDDAPAQ